MPFQSIFITGIDTGIGKTTITGALLLALQQQRQSIGVLKPIETGVDIEYAADSDTERLRQLLSPPPSFNSVCLYAFRQPLAPLAAARKMGVEINPHTIHSHAATLARQYSCLLIEGAGGIFTPIASQYTMRDLITLFQIPCIIVGHTELGGINHCLLTITALQQVGIKVLSIVLNEPLPRKNSLILQEQRESTRELIQEVSSVPVFGPIGFTQTIKTNWPKGVKELSGHLEIQKLASHINEKGQEIE